MNDIINDPGLLPWNSNCWTNYVKAWSNKTRVSSELLNNTPQEIQSILFKDDGYIQNNSIYANLVVNYATTLMTKYSISRVLDKLQVDTVDLACTPNPLEYSPLTAAIGTIEKPLTIHLILDRQSYDTKTLEQLKGTLERCAKNLLSFRFSSKTLNELNVIVKIIDTKEIIIFPKEWFRFNNISPGSKTASFMGLSSEETLYPEKRPTSLHGWRSRTPSSTLLANAASGTLLHKSELYIRWLKAKKDPLNVHVLDEHVIETNWPGAIKIFKAWSSLGIEERTTLLSILDATNRIRDSSLQKQELIDSTLFEFPQI